MLEYCKKSAEVRHAEALLVRTVQRLSINYDRDEHRELYGVRAGGQTKDEEIAPQFFGEAVVPLD